MDEEKDRLERNIAFWLDDARHERIGAWMTRLMAGVPLGLTGVGLRKILLENPSATGIAITAIGTGALYGLEKFARNEELSALWSEAQALPYQFELRDLE